MSSSKKKKLLTECSACRNTILARDAEKHKAFCSQGLDSDIQVLVPDKGLIAISCSVDKRDQYLPPDCFGWNKHNAVLVHPDTLSLLRALPRTPCLLSYGEGQRRLAVLWPCSEVPLLRISVPELPSERTIRVEVVEAGAVEHVALQPCDSSDDNASLLHSPHFKTYLKSYFTCAYLSASLVTTVHYFGRKIDFRVDSQLDDALSTLSLQNDDGCGVKPRVFYVQPKSAISIGPRLATQSTFTKTKCLSFLDIGGMARAKEDLRRFLLDPVKGNSDASSTVLWGLTGSGKTMFINALQSQLGSKAVRITTRQELLKVSSEADGTTGEVALIDDYDSWKSRQNSETSSVDLLCEAMDKGTFKAIVLTTRSIDALDLKLRRRFPLEIELTVPTLSERAEILQLLLDKSDRDKATELARETHGFTGADLLTMCRLAQYFKASKSNADAFEAARRRVTPTGLRQFVLEVPNVRWDDIGGNETLKTEVQQAVIWPYQHPEVFERLGVQPPSGILLYGPPGCSKTLVARALASQSKLNFLSVKGPELFSKWVGESERAVRELFHRARQVAPTILFFDEIDAVAQRRGGDGTSGVSDRVLAQLLTELDGLEKKSGVIVLAATNRPDTLDSAILRPGRLDRSIYVPLPDRPTRESIIRLEISKMQCDADVDIAQLADATHGYSGAETVALCRNAALLAMRENLTAASISHTHFVDSLSSVVPRTDKKMLAVYEKFSKGLTE